jgi:hypothetical protein
MFGAGLGNRNELTVPRLVDPLDEASVVGLLPDGKARARRPPRVEHLGVGARAGAQPLEEVQHKVVDVVDPRLRRGHPCQPNCRFAFDNLCAVHTRSFARWTSGLTTAAARAGRRRNGQLDNGAIK